MVYYLKGVKVYWKTCAVAFTRASAPLGRNPKISFRNSVSTSQHAPGREPSDVDRGVSGAKDRRPALDQLLADARRRKIDVLLCWRLDRLGRNLRHLVTLLDEMQAVGVAFVSLNEGIDTGTPAGRLQLHILAALAQFERERIRERVLAGLQRARAQGKRLGRPRQYRTAIAGARWFCAGGGAASGAFPSRRLLAGSRLDR